MAIFHFFFPRTSRRTPRPRMESKARAFLLSLSSPSNPSLLVRQARKLCHSRPCTVERATEVPEREAGRERARKKEKSRTLRCDEVAEQAHIESNPIHRHSPRRRRVDLARDLAGQVVDKRPGALGQGNELDGLAQERRRGEDDAVAGFRLRRRRGRDDGQRSCCCFVCIAGRLRRAQLRP